jgi:ABC-type transport system substrate-binding protein
MWQIEEASGLNLVRFADAADGAGLRIVPDAAAALPQLSNHGRTYTFRIRPGLRFSPPSGQPVTAETFKDTLERQITVDAQPFGAFLGEEVVGASRYLDGKATQVRGIQVRGDSISITILRRSPLNLLSLLALPYSSAVPINWVGPSSDGGVPSAGPYYIRSYVPNDQLILSRNPNYHGSRRGRIGEYTFREFRNPWQEVLAGHAVYTPDGSPPTAEVSAQIARYGPDSPRARAGDQRVFINASNYGALLYLLINTRTGPFTNALVRQAINDAINRRALAATWGPAATVLTDQYLVPGVPGFSGRRAGYPLDHPNVAAARALMRRAHVTLPIQATLLTGTDPAYRTRAAIITRDLSRIGIQLTTHNEPYTALVQTEDKPTRYSLVDANFQFAVPDAGLFLVGPSANWGEGPYTERFIEASKLPFGRRAREIGKLEIALARRFAPLAAYGYTAHIDYFANGIRGQVFQPYFGIEYTRLYESGHSRPPA